jgi:hypothetical protein
MAPQVQGMQKTGPQPEKRFLDRHLTVPEERGSEKETRLVAVGPLRHLRGGRPWRHGLPGVASTSLQALKQLTETISSLRPDPDGDEAGSTPQDGVGAVIGAEKRRDDAIAA